MNAIWALARKDLTLLLRDKSGFFFTFIFPIAYAVFFGSVLGGAGKSADAPGIKVAVVDQDNTPASAKFVKTLSGASELCVTPVADLTLADRMVNDKEAVGVIRIMPGYGAGQESIFWPAGEKSTVEVATDPSRKAEVGMLQGILQKYTFMTLGDTFSSPKAGMGQIDAVRKRLAADKDVKPADRLRLNTFFTATDVLLGGMDEPADPSPSEGDSNSSSGSGFALEPVKITTRELVKQRSGPPNAFTISFPQGIIWGVMGAALGFAASLLSERSAGTYHRLLAAPLPIWGVLAGKALACFLTMMGVCAGMIAVGVLLCGVTISNPLQLLVATVSVSLCYCGIMTLLATLARTERAASGIGWAVMLVLAFIGGAAVPSFIMPGWMQQISQFSPAYWAIGLFEGGLWRTLSTQFLITGLAVTLGIAGLGFVLGVASARRG